MKYFIIIMVIWNIFTFLLYGLDKLKAIKGKNRISEANLIWCAFVMGGIGAIFGQHVFHHKTQKRKFNILLPIALILNILIIFAIIAYFMEWI